MSVQDDQVMCILETAEQMKLEGRYHDAVSLLESLLADDPDNVSALEEVADNELSMEKYERAIIAAKRAVDLDDASYTGHYILGFVASLEERWSVAEQELKKANHGKPNNAEILRCLGWTLFNANKRVQGIVTLERSLNLDPENTLCLCDLGVCYLHMRNYKKAQTLFQRALDLDPLNERAIECIGAMKQFV